MSKVAFQTVKEVPVRSSNQENHVTYVSDQEHTKRLIQSYQEEIQTLKDMKEEEKQGKISQGRKKWFNKQIDRLRDKIREIEGDSNE